MQVPSSKTFLGVPLCLLASFMIKQADAAGDIDWVPALPALSWLQEHSNISRWYDPSPPAQLLGGRLTRGMCERRILPETFLYDRIDWNTHGEKQGEWLKRYTRPNQHSICWGEGAEADKWFDDMLEGKGCDRPWMVMSEEDVPVSSFQQFTQEAPAVMGLDPLIIEFCRNLTHDAKPVPHVNDSFWSTWKAAGMLVPEKSLGPISTIEHNLLHACSSANRNILRVSALAQAKTSWDMCANVQWVVCAAKGKLPNQGKTIEFAVPPGNLDGDMVPTYREYRSHIMRRSSQYEVDMMAWTFYVNEICFLAELCDNVDELWTLKRGEPWTCKHSPAGNERLRDSLKAAYQVVAGDQSSSKRMLSAPGGGHVSGGHVVGGHVIGGHIGGGHNTGIVPKIPQTTPPAPGMMVVTKVAATMVVELDLLYTMTQEVLQESFKKAIADVIGIPVENVMKLALTELVQHAGTRRLQVMQTKKKYEVSYEVIVPTSTEAHVIVNKANAIAQSSTLESETFQQALMSQDGVVQIHNVVLKASAYAFNETLEAPVGTSVAVQDQSKKSSMPAGIVALIVFVAFSCPLLILASIYLTMRGKGRTSVAKLDSDPEGGVARVPSHTLLDHGVRSPSQTAKYQTSGSDDHFASVIPTVNTVP